MHPILALETSCDESAVAIWGEQGLLASQIASQIDIHKRYGGVVPEVASRQHTLTLPPLVRETLRENGLSAYDFAAFAATGGPGLSSSLLIGHNIAKGLALACDKPFLSINHMEGHLLSPFLEPQNPSPEIPPHLGLIVSGGHTMLVEVKALGDYRVMGKTRDDAAGEAFDKVARLLGLPYPGGPEIEKLALEGKPDAYSFPRAFQSSKHYDFSFSGLKTSVRYTVEKISEPREHLADLCASFQHAVIDALVTKTLGAAKEYKLDAVALSGGVACNKALREALAAACEGAGLRLHLASPQFTTDNAAMIAFAAWLYHKMGSYTSITEDIDPNLSLTP